VIARDRRSRARGSRVVNLSWATTRGREDDEDGEKAGLEACSYAAGRYEW